jgi:hypothetical protein
MDEFTREQEEAVAATVGAIQRIAMALREVGIEGATAHAWLNNTMHGIESALVGEIEAGGGAAGGNA